MAKSLKEKLLDNKIILIHTEMSKQDVTEAMMNFLNWNIECPNEEIQLFVSTETHDYCNTMAMYDTLKSIQNPIAVYCIGQVSDFGLLFLAAASKGRRYALKHTEFRLNQPIGSLGPGPTQQTEIAIAAKRASRERECFEEALAEAFSVPLEKIHKDCEAELRLKAEEAKKYGLIDEILE